MEHKPTNSSGALAVNLSLLFLIIALLIWFGFQTMQLVNERNSLKTLHGNQEQTIVNSQKMRTQLDAIAAGTKHLADQGNANAQLVVQQLAKNGININSNAQAPAAPK